MKILGLFYDGADPSAALVIDGKTVSFAEEERFVRLKHAWNYFPSHAIQYCLQQGGLGIEDIDYITYAWDCPKFSNGYMKNFYASVHHQYEVDERTLEWEQKLLNRFHVNTQREYVAYHLRSLFGDVGLPELCFLPHHYVHAFSAFFYSPFRRAIVLTIDGSGDENCTTIWRAEDDELIPLQEIQIPHSCGWFYAAFTEYLGFRAYDGEYKVMGLAAYGRKNEELVHKVRQVLYDTEDAYEINPYYVFYGEHRYSERFTDKLVDLLGRRPRLDHEPIEAWHEDLAWAVQHCLEQTTIGLVERHVRQSGIRNLCVSGGVGLNIKMNERLLESGVIDDIFVQPICSDTGTSFASAACLEFQMTGTRPEVMADVYFGPSYEDEAIESYLQLCKVNHTRSDDVAHDVAKLLAADKIVGWFQGRMEGGPRALGSRSILANPTKASAKDRVNEVIKFREYWRPFCPSMTEEDATRFLTKQTDAPFMILGFQATELAQQLIPAVVHVDNSVRVQIVKERDNPLYYRLLREFGAITGSHAVLNTSFNIKGEPIVCTPQDAVRTFFSTGIDALAIGNFLIVK